MDSPVTAVIATAVIATASAAAWGAFRRRRRRGHEDWPVGMQPVEGAPLWGEKS